MLWFSLKQLPIISYHDSEMFHFLICFSHYLFLINVVCDSHINSKHTKVCKMKLKVKAPPLSFRFQSAWLKSKSQSVILFSSQNNHAERFQFLSLLLLVFLGLMYKIVYDLWSFINIHKYKSFSIYSYLDK